jgi:hypothetical protein
MSLPRSMSTIACTATSFDVLHTATLQPALIAWSARRRRA